MPAGISLQGEIAVGVLECVNQIHSLCIVSSVIALPGQDGALKVMKCWCSFRTFPMILDGIVAFSSFNLKICFQFHENDIWSHEFESTPGAGQRKKR